MRQQWEDMTDGQFRGFVNSRINELSDNITSVDTKVDNVTSKIEEVLTILRLGKMGAGLIKWLAGLGAALAAIYSAWHFTGPK